MRSYQKNPKIGARYKGSIEIRNGRPTFNGNIRLMWNDLERPLKVKKPTVWSIWNDFLLAPPIFIDAAFDIMEACPEHTFLILTKRAELLESKIYDPTSNVPIRHLGPGDFLSNVYWGVTVEHQEYVHRIKDLLRIPGRHFISIEPCLGYVDLNAMPPFDLPGNEEHGTVTHYEAPWDEYLDGIILGGELGPRARPMHPEWVRSVRDQCVGAGVPFFFKQWGEWTGNPGWYLQENISPSCKSIIKNRDDKDRVGTSMGKIGKKAAGRLLDGREWNELPWRN